MQLDEDVGKVAQATPVLICKQSNGDSKKSPLSHKKVAKALELFMQSLIDQACQETRQRHAKRLTAAHL